MRYHTVGANSGSTGTRENSRQLVSSVTARLSDAELLIVLLTARTILVNTLAAIRERGCRHCDAPGDDIADAYLPRLADLDMALDSLRENTRSLHV